ncbi:L,D-transpeptidase, partial [Luedemannella flava]|uniref:L,D-transpeptidase n=1 Tax=Luedemannella flava TaxID=349316 RepID=UPI0031DB3416
PASLPVISYDAAPGGFPRDPAPLSTAPLTEGLHPVRRVAVYDAPGGRPRAFLGPDILGAPLTVPVVARRAGWTAVLLPSVNRRIGWLPPRRGAWTTTTLRDLIIVVRRTHELTWLRDGVPQHTWPVTLGLTSTPTPLGRTFILGRSRLPGMVYGDTDVFALGAVPDKPHRVPYGLRGAHIGIHTWYHDGDLGRNTTDGCIRLTRWGQRKMLAQVPPGTPVVVLDDAPPPAPPRPVRSYD